MKQQPDMVKDCIKSLLFLIFRFVNIGLARVQL